MEYCFMQGWQIVGIYQDDGYTGLNMNRPDLQRMLEVVNPDGREGRSCFS